MGEGIGGENTGKGGCGARAAIQYDTIRYDRIQYNTKQYYHVSENPNLKRFVEPAGAEAIQINGAARGAARRQYREREQRLYK